MTKQIVSSKKFGWFDVFILVHIHILHLTIRLQTIPFGSIRQSRGAIFSREVGTDGFFEVQKLGRHSGNEKWKRPSCIQLQSYYILCNVQLTQTLIVIICYIRRDNLTIFHYAFSCHVIFAIVIVW